MFMDIAKEGSNLALPGLDEVSASPGLNARIQSFAAIPVEIVITLSIWQNTYDCDRVEHVVKPIPFCRNSLPLYCAGVRISDPQT